MGRRKKPSKKIKNNTKELSKNDDNDESLVSILNISLRLGLPFIKTIDSDDNDDEDDEETLEFQIRPRFVFMSNLCLVCMQICNNIHCENCKMVSYCSVEHKNNDKINHHTLCNALKEICKGMEGFSLAKTLTPDLYRLFRIKTITIIENKINRKLDLWEREILLYPKICRSCKKIDNELTLCPECRVDYYCSNHNVNHKKWCKDFQIYYKIITMQYRYGFTEPCVPNFYTNEPYVLPENFDFLIYNMFKNNSVYRNIDVYTYASLSCISTVPLTTLFSIQKTIHNWYNYEVLTIDIIGAEFTFECVSLRVWEKFLLHLLPNLKIININFTGPELILPSVPIRFIENVKICRKCKLLKRKINVKFNAQKLYHHVDDAKADIVCLFNPGLYRNTGYDGNDTWPDTIKKFCCLKVPVVVTSYTEFEIPHDVERIKSIFDVKILMEPQKNPFASVKPDRNFVSDDVAPLMYKNNCITIIQGL